MPLQPEVFSLVFALAIAISLLAAVQAWSIRDEPGGLALVGCLLGIAFWAACVFGTTVVPGTPLTMTLLKLRLLGINITIFGMFVATIGYTGYGEYITPRTIGGLTAWPVVLNLIVWTRPELVWAVMRFDPTVGTGVETAYGPVFWIHAGYAYLLVVISVALLIRFTLASRYVYQKQIAVVVGGIIAPLVTNFVYVTKLVDYDVTVVGFILTAMSLSWVLQHERFFDVRPIARDRVLETLTTGMVIADGDDRLVDCNQRATDILELSPADIGSPIADLDTPLPANAERAAAEPTDTRQADGGTTGADPTDTEQAPTEPTADERTAAERTDGDRTDADTTDRHTYQVSIEDRHYEITTTPLHNDRDYRIGTVFLVVDITDQERRKARLRQQNERLDQFAAVVSHDLRNPLSVAGGYLKLARDTGDAEYFDQVEQSHRRMDELIEELLTFARLDGDLETEAVTLRSCAETAWGHVDTDEATLVADDATTISANPEYLLQFLENLFRNAIEHGGPAVTVTVSADETGSFTVADDGPGIPPEDREAVLERGHTSGSGGAGLGLSIVTEIADAHGWSVRVEESEVGGAAFVFEGVETGIFDGEAPSQDTH